MSRFGKFSIRKLVLLGLPAALALVILVSVLWVLKTSSGAAWAWAYLEEASVGAVRSSRVEGDLASGFVIRELTYRADDLEVSIRQVELKAEPGWWPLSVQVRSLLLRDVDIVTRTPEGQAGEVQGEVDIGALLESLKLGFPVRVHSAELTNLTLQTDDRPPNELLESLRLVAGLEESLKVDSFEILADGIKATLNGQLALEPPFNVAVMANGRVDTRGPTDDIDLLLPFKLESTGNLDGMKFTLASTEEGLALGGELLDLSVSGTGSSSGLKLDEVTLTGEKAGLSASGDVTWSTPIRAGAKLAIQHLDLSPWIADWPAGEILAGNLALDWSGKGLAIPVGKFTVAGTGLVMDINADINTRDNTLDVRLDWNDLSWPLSAESPDFFSPSGNLSANGSLDQWVAGGQLHLELGEYPQGSLDVQGSGNRTSGHVSILDGEVLGGRISGEANADWENALVWDMALRTRNIDPEPLVPGWPGRLDADIEIETTNQPGLTRIDILSLQGLIRGVRIRGEGGIVMSDDVMTFEGVEIRSDDAVLQLDGATSDTSGVAFEFNGSLPSMLLQGASGNVELEGRYTTDAGGSSLDVQLQALDLAWNGFSTRELAISTQSTGVSGSIPAMQLDAIDFEWQDVQLNEISISLEPADRQHRLKAGLNGDKFSINSTMTLTPSDGQDPFASKWQGLLEELVVSIDKAYRFELQNPAPLQWQPGSVSLGATCLRGDSDAALCLNGDYQSNGDWALVAEVSAFPLNYLRDAFELDIYFEQLIEGRLEWRKLHDQAPTGGADFRITEGRVLDPEDNDVLAETSEGRFGFALTNGNLESGVLEIELPAVGFIDIDFDVLDIIENGERKLQGRAITRLDDLKSIGQVVLPWVDDINGQFESNIHLGGTLGDPAFDGGFKFSNGLVRYAPIGLKLENIEFEGLLERLDRGSLNGSFQAGAGTGTIDGRFNFEDLEDVRIDAAFSGDQLTLVNTDDLKIDTEADLKLGISPQRLEIGGHIRVPSARLTSSNLLLEKAIDSADLVIEGRETTAGSGVEVKTPKNKVHGQLEVAFGDDVLISVPGVESNISGSVLFNWNGDPLPSANGRYVLKGKVDVYGPTLQMENGQISFPDIAADNPILNIRAEREVYGNTQIRSAGVRVIGTLKRPVLEAYTVPVTNEDRAWTLLITGTDFDQGQGVSGFDVGTYIAPKLYVSYGISLFEDENVVSARYDLKKGFGVKVTSGQRETGLDISYTINR